jgi:hypothetical protein
VDHKERIGYLVNMHSSELIQEEDKKLVACVDYYFIQVQTISAYSIVSDIRLLD